MALNIERNIETLEESASARGGVWFFVLAALRSRYFMMSLAFYTLLLLIFGGHVVSIYVAQKGVFQPTEELLVLPERTPPPPRPQQQQPTADAKDVPVEATTPTAKSTVARLTVDAPSSFVRTPTPMVAPTVSPADIKISTDLSRQIEASRIARLMSVRDFQEGWKVQNYRTPNQVKAEFTFFQAKYQDGDWNCNPGALPNMMRQIRAWSSDRIKANMHPEVLDIGTEQLFDLKPPFVYLTGHKDFKLLDTEVRNLRDYLMLGGAVWADSALAGRRSRFDVAFRREMKRVMPDRDFEIIDLSHDLFQNSFFRKIDLPSGMNYYQEPVEIINIGDEIAVVYTLNGYGHFWETRLNKQDKIEWGQVNVGEIGKPRWVHVHGPHLRRSDGQSAILYRNINDKTVVDSYKFGINVVVHLLIRYQKYIQFLPRKLPELTGMRGRPEKKEPEEGEGTNAPSRQHRSLGGATRSTDAPLVKPGLLK